MADSVKSEYSGSVPSQSSKLLSTEKLQFRFKFDSAADDELKSRTVLVCEVMEDCHLKSFSSILISSEEDRNHKIIPVSGSPKPGTSYSVLTKQDINIIDRSLDVVGR